MPLRYSERLHWSAAENSLSAAVAKRRAAGELLDDLTQSNPTNAGILYPEVTHRLVDDCSRLYEPSARGIQAAREAVASYYEWQVGPERILLTASTSEAYSYLFKLLCDPGDEVMAPRPSYPLFETLAQLECIRIRQYPLRYHGEWLVDIDALRRAVTERTRAIVWVNPNNPTGSYLKQDEYEEIASLCEQHGLALISDEVFSDYGISVDPRAVSKLIGRNECLSFSLSGLSKVCGLPQMKLGWIVASGPGHETALQRLEWIADAYLSVGAPVQCAAATLLSCRDPIQQQIRDRAVSNLEFLRRATAESPCRLLRVEGGWYATLQVPRTRSEEAWALLLLENGVLVQPGYFFDFESEAYLVLSLLTEPATLARGVKHILDGCSSS